MMKKSQRGKRAAVLLLSFFLIYFAVPGTVFAAASNSSQPVGVITNIPSTPSSSSAASSAASDPFAESSSGSSSEAAVSSEASSGAVSSSGSSSGENSGVSSGTESAGSGTEGSVSSGETPREESQEEGNYRPENSRPFVPNATAAPSAITSAPAESRGATDFTSEDLNTLLSGAESSSLPSVASGSSSSSSSSVPAVGGIFSADSSSSSAEQKTSGGLSSIFLSGIVLIVLGLCGIGVFIYLQFFRDRAPSGAKGSSGSSPRRNPKKSNPDLYEYDPRDVGPAPDREPAEEDSFDDHPGTETYVDISSDGEEKPEESGGPTEFADISSGRTDVPKKAGEKGGTGDNFDWDEFFEKNKNPKS